VATICSYPSIPPPSHPVIVWLIKFSQPANYAAATVLRGCAVGECALHKIRLTDSDTRVGLLSQNNCHRDVVFVLRRRSHIGSVSRHRDVGPVESIPNSHLLYLFCIIIKFLMSYQSAWIFAWQSWVHLYPGPVSIWVGKLLISQSSVGILVFHMFRKEHIRNGLEATNV